MLLRRFVVLTGLAAFQAAAADAPQTRAADLTAAREAMRAGNYADAIGKYQSAVAPLSDAKSNVPEIAGVMVELATAARLNAQFDVAEASLRRALEANETAALLSELAAVQRAQGKTKEALATLRAAIQKRSQRQGDAEELAKDLTTAGLLEVEVGEKTAKETLERAVAAWRDAKPAGSLQILTAMDALAGLLREATEYEQAEPLYVEALRLREAALGPNASELIATVDSLAYVYFGQKKYAAAEPMYKRLLALWEYNAKPDHPMVALTLDKMGEFYAAQERYAEAEPLVRRSLDLRSKVLIESFNQNGRILLMQARLTDAQTLYERAVRIGDDLKVEPEVMDPVLRIYSRILREMNRTEEADALVRRVKAALMEKADREGRRPSPMKTK